MTDDDPDVDDFTFEWFNERFPDEMARCIAAFDAARPLATLIETDLP